MTEDEWENLPERAAAAPAVDQQLRTAARAAWETLDDLAGELAGLGEAAWVGELCEKAAKARDRLGKALAAAEGTDR